MRRFGILHPLALSFFSRTLYRDVGLRWPGTGLLYLLLLVALAWVPTILKAHLALSRWVDTEAAAFLSQVPRIVIENGVVDVEAEMPCVIKDPGTGEELLVMDTTGQIASLEGIEAQILLTDHMLHVRKGAAEIRSWDLSGIAHFELTRERLRNWLETFRDCFALLAYPVLVLGTWALRLLQILLYASLGLIFNRMCRAGLGYPALLRLSAVAVTPAVLLGTLTGLLDFDIPFAGLLGFLLSMGCLFFGVKACAGEEAGPAPAA